MTAVIAPSYLPFLVKSKAAYAARSANEISLVAGQTYVVDQTDGKGYWWKASADQTHGTGWFPAGYTEVVGPVPADPKPQSPIAPANPTPTPNPRPTPNPVPRSGSTPVPPARSGSNPFTNAGINNSAAQNLPTPPARAQPTPVPQTPTPAPIPQTPIPQTPTPAPVPTPTPATRAGPPPLPGPHPTTPQPQGVLPQTSQAPLPIPPNSGSVVRPPLPAASQERPPAPKKTSTENSSVDSSPFSLTLQILDVKGLRPEPKKVTIFIFRKDIYSRGDNVGHELFKTETTKGNSPSFNEAFRIVSTDPEAEVIIVRIVNGEKWKSSYNIAEREIPLRAMARVDFTSPQTQFKYYPLVVPGKGNQPAGEIKLFLEFFDKNKYEAPSNFQRISHVGVDANGQFNASDIPEEWKKKLKELNFPKSALKNAQVREQVFGALANESGGVIPPPHATSPPPLPPSTGRAPVPPPTAPKPAPPLPQHNTAPSLPQHNISTPPLPQSNAAPPAAGEPMKRGGPPPPPPAEGMKRGGGPPPPPLGGMPKPKPAAAPATGAPTPAPRPTPSGPDTGDLFAEINSRNFKLKPASEREEPAAPIQPQSMSLAETLASALASHRLDIAGGGDDWGDDDDAWSD